jgi:uncharacterized lipoprotein YddW (UPF0748 family)
MPVNPRLACAAVCFAAAVQIASAGAPPLTLPLPPASEVRALWVARTTLTSPAAIARMVRAARNGRFNTLLVQVRGRGDAYFNGGSEPRAQALSSQPASFDPLKVTLAEARRAGLRVHAWVNVNLVSSAVDLPASRSHVIYRHPEWLMVPRGLAKELRVLDDRSPLYVDKLARTLRQSGDAEGLYVSPISPGAVDYIATIVRDLVSRYPLDGLHLDYVRYPSDDFDYSRLALSLFASETARDLPAAEAEALRASEAGNPFAWTEAYPDRWTAFRRARLTALVERVRRVVKAERPRALLSAAVAPDATDAAARRLQDWRRWVADGTLDVVCPMAYAPDLDTFTAQVTSAREAAGTRTMWAGIGAYRLSAAQTIESILVARRLGATGIVLFSYDSLAEASPNGQSLSKIGRAVF